MSDARQKAFWDDEEEALWAELAELFMGTLMDGTQEGVDILPENMRALVDWNWVNKAALSYARAYRYEWIREISAATRKQTQVAIADWIEEGSPLAALEARLGPIFGEARAQMIAATEVTRVYSHGNQEAWEASGVVTRMVSQTAQDELVCEVCGPMAGRVIGIGDIDAAPPYHVNCRCWLQPQVDEERIRERRAERLGLL